MGIKQYKKVIGILSLNLLLMLISSVTSAIAAIAKSFPNEPISKVQSLGSVPALGQIVATAMFSYLAYKMTRKDLGLIGIAIVGIAGLVPAFYHSSLNIILFCMIMVGFGIGLITNIVPVLLQKNFEGEARATAMGWSTGVTNIGMMFFTALGGFLGSKNWHHLFWIFASAFIVFLLAFILIPQDEKIKYENKERKNKSSFFDTLKHLNGYVYLLYLIGFLLSVTMMTFMSNLSIVLASQGKGTAYVGVVSSLGNIGGIITAAFLVYIKKFTKKNTIAWGFVAFAISFICIAFFKNMILHVIGNAFSGVGIVLINATTPYEMSILTSEKDFPLAVSINTLIGSIAGMLLPILLASIGIKPGYSSFLAGLMVSATTAIILFVTKFGYKIEKIGNNK